MTPPPLRCLFALALLASLAPAQREKPKLDFQGREAVLEYGPVRLGKHSLDELKPGNSWRLGRNTASTFSATCPVFGGADDVVAPGSYRVSLVRDGEKKFSLHMDGSGDAVLSRGAAVAFPGDLTAGQKPAEQLEIDWVPDGQKKDEAAKAAKLRIRFGEWHVLVPMWIPGTKPMKAPGWNVDAFLIPEATLEARYSRGRATPVLTFRKPGKPKGDDPAGWNLLVSKTEARFVPWMEAPTDSFGFGAVQPPPEAKMRKGSVVWQDASEKKAHLEVSKLERVKEGDFQITLAFGAHVGTVRVPDPLAPAPTNRQ